MRRIRRVAFLILAVSLIQTSLAQETRPENDRAIEQELVNLRRRANAGDAQAQVELGMAFATGYGVALNNEEAVAWFRKAAEQEDVDGEYALGEMYATGRGVLQDYAEALKWIRRAAEKGHPQGQFNLSAMYKHALGGLEKSDTEAAKWMRKAADQGLAAGQFGMGSMYEDGAGVQQDVQEAIRWYRMAAEQDDASALNNLALVLATSKEPSLRNTKEAIQLATRALEVGGQSDAVWDTLATAYFEDGQYERAVEAQQQALGISPDKASYKEALKKYEAAAASQSK